MLTARLANTFNIDEAAARNAWAWIAWTVFALLVAAIKFDIAPTQGNVFYIYREAAVRWQTGQDLYPAEYLFNYFPPSAVLFIPWTVLPFDVGGAIWRILNIAVFALGVWRICSLNGTGSSHSNFLFTSIITIILSGSAAQHGQMTLAMAGLMMMAATAIQRGALWRAAAFSVIAVALKPNSIVLMLVLVAVYPRLIWRAAIVGAAVAVIPFFSQSADYVISQYAAVPDMLQTRALKPDVFPNVFGLFTTLGWAATDIQQMIMRGACALFVLVSCWRVRWRVPAWGVAFSLYTLTTCYILLLGYGTERNTYAMMAPIIGLLAANARFAPNRLFFRFMIGLTIASLLSYTLQRASPDTPLAMIRPIVCIVLFVLASWASWRAGLTIPWQATAKP